MNRFADIPLLDHHCHALRRPGPPLDAAAFRRHFSESRDPAMAAHLPTSLFYRRALRDLAALLGCDATEEAVLAAREQPSPEAHARRLFEAANIGAALVDTGFLSTENFALDDLRAVLPCPVHEVLRLETLAETLIAATNGFGEMEEAFRATLKSARANGVVAFKSIAAYRGGLAMGAPGWEAAAARFRFAREQTRRGDSARLTERPLLEYLLHAALEVAAAEELPVQFHTGFGDDDADLRTANPLHLRPLLQDPRLRGARFVLLHCWPFAREAGYLAALYGNVFVDLSLTIPFTGPGGTRALLAALEQAPVSKVLLATDAFSIPELFYLGALYAREALAQALEELVRVGWMSQEETEGAARAMLHENAKALYSL